MESTMYHQPQDHSFQALSEQALLSLLQQQSSQLENHNQRFWQAIALAQPELWAQHPFGDEGCGFWVVAVCGQQCLYYNDICAGFSLSHFQHWGQIDAFQPEAFELQNALAHLLNTQAVA